MKKKYITPVTSCCAVQTQNIMTISGEGIPFGGIDNGMNTPGSRYRNSLWDEEEDEEDW